MIKYGQIYAVVDFLETDNRGEDGFVLAYSAHALLVSCMGIVLCFMTTAVLMVPRRR